MNSNDLIIWNVKLGKCEWAENHPDIVDIVVESETAQKACELAIEWEKEAVGDDLVVIAIKIEHSFVVRSSI